MRNTPNPSLSDNERDLRGASVLVLEARESPRPITSLESCGRIIPSSQSLAEPYIDKSESQFLSMIERTHIDSVRLMFDGFLQRTVLAWIPEE